MLNSQKVQDTDRLITIIVGDRSNLSNGLSERIKYSEVFSSSSLSKSLSQLTKFKEKEVNIIFNNFQTSSQLSSIEDHFDNSYELESQLSGTSKEHLLKEVKEIIKKSTFTNIRQKKKLGLVHAILTSQPLIGDEPFAVILADDL